MSYRVVRSIRPMVGMVLPNHAIPADDLAGARVDMTLTAEPTTQVRESRDIRAMVAASAVS